MIKVLLNGCGDREVINLLHSDEDIHITFVSNVDKDSVSKVVDDCVIADYPKNEVEYIDYLINICLDKNIDIVIPYKRMRLFAKYYDKFVDHNIKVLIPSNLNTYTVFNDKHETYEMLKGVIGEELVPKYFIVNNIDEYCHAVEEISKTSDVCVKYVSDIASNSFRILNLKSRSIKELDIKTKEERNKLIHMIDNSVLEEMIRNEGLKKPLMVMEYVEGQEVSCDCVGFRNSDDNLIIPRFKLNDKEQVFMKDNRIIDLCNKIINYSGYDSICNIQFIKNGDDIKLLEINTRMSGGIYLSSYGTDINLPIIAIYDALGIMNNKEISFDWEPVKMNFIMDFDFESLS